LLVIGCKRSRGKASRLISRVRGAGPRPGQALNEVARDADLDGDQKARNAKAAKAQQAAPHRPRPYQGPANRVRGHRRPQLPTSCQNCPPPKPASAPGTHPRRPQAHTHNRQAASPPPIPAGAPAPAGDSLEQGEPPMSTAKKPGLIPEPDNPERDHYAFHIPLRRRTHRPTANPHLNADHRQDTSWRRAAT
jgi:hypothetical protein